MKAPLAVLTCLVMLAIGDVASAQEIFVDEEGRSIKQSLLLPYVFYNENFGAAGGFVYGLSGFPQPQSSLIATGMAGTKGSGMLALLGRDIRIPGTERLFLDPIVSAGYFDDADAYIDGEPGFPNERAGSNDSDEDNFVSGKGWDNFFRFRFKYLLPIGDGADEIISRIRLDRGLPLDPPEIESWWNPLASGKTYLELRPFYRWQQIDGDFADEDIKTNGTDLSLYWDNRDFFANPSVGHSLLLKASRDFGLLDSDNSWTVLQGEWDAYVPLGIPKSFRQSTLAFDFWTAYSPSWDETSSGEIENRAPAYTGATLGGLWRLRGYPGQRFSDKAAIYYGAELRLIPDWNPFENWPKIQKYVGIKWLQLVPFVEVGRVAPNYDLNELHSDMKWDAGLGLRLWAKGLVVRVDAAWSEEGAGIQMMMGQPFQF